MNIRINIKKKHLTILFNIKYIIGLISLKTLFHTHTRILSIVILFHIMRINSPYLFLIIFENNNKITKKTIKHTSRHKYTILIF